MQAKFGAFPSVGGGSSANVQTEILFFYVSYNIIAVTVDIQAAFEDVLVSHVILMAQLLPSTSTVLY